MKFRTFVMMSAVAMSLAGCINLPQTKALITPVGAVGIHSFAPPPHPAKNVDFEQRRTAQQLQRTEAELARKQDRS